MTHRPYTLSTFIRWGNSVRYIWLLVAAACILYVALTAIRDVKDDRVTAMTFRMKEQMELWKGRYLLALPGCQLPYVDPDNEVIMKDWFRTNHFTCKQKRHIFSTKIVERNRSCPLLLEEILWEDYSAMPGDLSCSYVNVSSEFSSDNWMNTVVTSQPRSFDVNICPEEGLIWIKCLINDETYEQPLYTIPPNRERNVPFFDRKRERVNILVLGIDSLSRQSFHRTMKGTKRALQTIYGMDSIELKAFNKVGINSAPNQIPMLTGKRFRHEQDMNKGEFFEDFSRFIWQDFAEQGYETMFVEEQMDYGLFTYPSRKGFRKVPTHHWPRPLMIQRDRLRVRLRASSPENWECLGGEHISAAVLRYWMDAQEISPRPLFSYVWLSDSTHESVTGGSHIDQVLADFFYETQRRGMKDKTVVFFLADHGYRVAPYRDTPLGRIEDNLPFAYILLPKWFRKHFPYDVARLELNSNRLTTPYDIHATLSDLVLFSNDTKLVEGTTEGLSLLSDVVPKRRTCENAGIDPSFCSCYRSQTIDAPSEVTTVLGNLVVESINKVLNEQGASRCIRIHSPRVTRFVKLLQGNEPSGYVQITLLVSPASLQFEATFKKVNGTFTQLGLPDRLDRHDIHSYCAHNLFYQKFCYCAS